MKKFKMEDIVLQFHRVHRHRHLILILLLHKSPHHPFLRDSFHLLQYLTVLWSLLQFLSEQVYPHPFQLGPPTHPLLLLLLPLVEM
jgi:hypothetical protein